MSDVRRAEYTAFVRKLRKVDLEAELSRVRLQTEGSRDELRQRLLAYVRDNTQEFYPILWIFQLSEEGVREEIRDVGLSEEGTVGDLYYRLLQYVRTHPSEYTDIVEPTVTQVVEIPQTGTSTQPVMVNFPKRPVVEIVRKWNIHFKTGDSVFTFLERINDLKQSSNVNNTELLSAMPELLRDTALLWYRNNKHRLISWELFEKEFKLNFLAVDIEDALIDEIRLRTQGEKESLSDYVTALCTLMRRLPTPYTTDQELKLLRKNLRPDYKLFIGDKIIRDVSDLLNIGRLYEKILTESEHYKPPPPVHKSIDKETAYDVWKGKVIPHLQLVNVENKLGPEKMALQNETKEQCSSFNTSNRNLMLAKCWNCGMGDHKYRECRQVRKQFCYGCGKSNTTVRNCDCRRIRNEATAKQEYSRSPRMESRAIAESGRQNNKHFIKLEIDKYTLYALPDTGADQSFLGQKGYDICCRLGMNIEKFEREKVVQMADGSNCNIIGTVILPIVLRGKTHKIKCIIMPSLTVDLLLGRETLSLMGLVMNLAKQTWFYYQCPQQEYNFDSLYSGERCCNNVLEESELGILHCLFLTECEQQRLDEFLSQQMQLFDGVSGITRVVEHVIDTGKAQPVKQRYYPVSPPMLKIMHDQIDEMLRDEVIEESNSAWSSPVVLVKKPDGKYRFCINFQKVNSLSKRDSYPLPYIEHILNKLKGAQYMSTIDLRNGYWQVPLKESSREKTAFTVPGKGLFQFRVMPFGLHNAAATFQRLVENVLKEDINETVFCYLDDIILISKTFSEHLILLEKIFRKLREANLRINVEKSKFCREELKYLGHIVGRNGISVDPEKVACISNYPVPQNVKQLKSYLGLISWYRRFVPQFAEMVAPLQKLLKKKAKWHWTKDCQEAFEESKQKLIESRVLNYPDFSKSLVVQTDASFSGLGAALTQNIEGEEKVITFASRALTDTEKKYSVTEKELLAVLWAIQKFRPYIEGFHFIVITDHFALKWIHGLKNPTGRLARWCLLLQEYHFTVVHRKGAIHKVPDALSRIPQNFEGNQQENRVEIETICVLQSDSDILTDFNMIQDQWYIDRREAVLTDPDRWSDWQVQGDRLYHYRFNKIDQVLDGSIDHWKLVVPKEYRAQVMQECHDQPSAGHPGVTKTFLRISQVYYWPGLFNDVLKYVKSCISCQEHKVEQKLTAGKMGYRRIEKPWSRVTSDILGPYPTSKKRNKYIIVFQDHFTKWVEAKPVSSVTTKSVIEAFHRLVVLKWGTPEILLCDNGSQYTSKFMRQVCQAYNVKLEYTPLYTPQANPTERANRVLKTMITCYIEGKQTDWDVFLPDFCYAMNTAVHAATKCTPALLNLGRELQWPSQLREQIDTLQLSAPEDWVKKLSNLVDIQVYVNENLEQAYKKSKHNYNLRRRELKFEKGDKVMRKNYVISAAWKQMSAGLAPKFIGPFEIARVVSHNVYELKDLKGKLVGKWHVKDLKPYITREQGTVRGLKMESISDLSTGVLLRSKEESNFTERRLCIPTVLSMRRDTKDRVMRKGLKKEAEEEGGVDDQSWYEKGKRL